MVLDIESVDSYKIFALEGPYRIVIDVSGEKHEAPAKGTRDREYNFEE